jgi:diguanylate cyclase (GGDEF)-like protein/PAS domain S-box-containing protein
VPPDRPSRPVNGFDLDRFFDYAVDMLCIADGQGYFRRVNRSFERVLGYTKEELLSRPFVEFVHPDDRFDTIAETGRLSSGELTLSFENRYIAKDGTAKHISWTCYPDPESGLLYAVARDVTAQRLRENRLDGITGVPNRQAWDDAVSAEWRRAIRQRIPVGIALLDVDHLRPFNEVEGHLSGDRRLREIAEAMHGCLRRTGDLVARYQGGTFAVLLAGCADLRAAVNQCERLRSAVEGLGITYDGAGGSGRLTVSGAVVSRVPTRHEEPEPVLQGLAASLANAKAAGGNRIIPALA